MNERLQQYIERLDAMALRERVLIFAALALMLILIANTVFIAPLRAKQSRLVAEMTQQQKEMDALQDQLHRLVQSSSGDPDAPRLESVLIASDRRLAVINGQQYNEGASYRDGHVLRISESEVIIRRPGGDEALKLYPQDIKRASGSAAEGK